VTMPRVAAPAGSDPRDRASIVASPASPPATQSGAEADGQGFDLIEFMHAVIAAGPRPRPVKPGEPAVRRSWLPHVDGSEDRPPGGITACNAHLGCFRRDLPAMPRSTHVPRSAWGRLKRFHSEVAGAMLLAESSLEFDVLRNAELDPDVMGIVEQPFRLRYWLGKWRTYTPDILLATGSGMHVTEVKYEEDAAHPLIETKWRAIGETLSAMGMGFSVVTERHVRCQPRKRNTEVIYRRRHVQYDFGVAGAMADWLDGSAPTGAGVAAATFGLDLNQVWAMVRHLRLAVDLDAGPLGPETIIQRRARPPIGGRNGGLAG